MKPVLLLDTHSLVFRAFHGLPQMNTTTGEPTNAVYGFSVLLLKLLREEKPLGFAFALDSPKPTFRRERYAEYKAGRAKAPDALRHQLDRTRQLIEATGAPAFCEPGFEADDVLATLARELREQATPVLVVSGDRDILQCARDTTRVMFVGARGKKPTLFDEAAVRERFGVAPVDLPSRTALLGDSSDNLPSVPGVGEKTATRLLERFANVRALLDHVGEVTPDRLRDAIESHRAQILETEDLARLRDEVPLPAGPRYAALGPESLARLRTLFEELEFTSLRERLEKLA